MTAIRSTAEVLLAEQLRQAGIPFHREFRFAPPRRFRSDFMVMTLPRLLIEIEGGGWVQGHHSRGQGIEDDCEKSALAAIRGFRCMRVTPKQVEDGRALEWIRAALGLEAAA